MKATARVLASSLLVFAVLPLTLSLAPHALLRSSLDRLADDGTLELYTPALAHFIQPLLITIGLFLIAGGLACLVRPDWALQTATFPRRLVADGREFIQALTALRLSSFEWSILALALTAGIWARLVLLRSPMQYDEAYTWIAFASRPFAAILTDYHLPNNHIFHTLLVHGVALFCGPEPCEPWVIRLPAFLAGVLMIPAAWLAGRSLFSRSTGLLAAGLVAAWPYLVEYGANARGYTLTGLFTLLIFALGPILLARRNAFAWLLVALLCTLGLFTVPVMLYPAGVFFTALLLSTVRGFHRPAWTLPPFLAALTACLLCIGLITFILYLPVIVVSGPQSLFGNPFVRTYSWLEWLSGLGVWGRGIFDSWILNIPFWVYIPVFALACLSLFIRPQETDREVGHKPKGMHGCMIHPIWAALLFFAVILPLQRPELQAKAFFTIVPLILLSSAAGWTALVEGRGMVLRSWILLVPIAALSAWCLLQARPVLPYLLHGDKGSWQSATEYVASRYQPGQAVLATFPFDPQVWYYGNRSGIPREAFQSEVFEQAWVLASKPLADMLRERGPKDGSLRPENCRLEAKVMDVPIYLCMRYP